MVDVETQYLGGKFRISEQTLELRIVFRSRVDRVLSPPPWWCYNRIPGATFLTLSPLSPHLAISPTPFFSKNLHGRVLSQPSPK